MIARRVQSTDLADLCRIDSDPRVMETLGGVRERDATAADLKYDMEHWERHGFGLYLVKSTRGEVVGRVGLRCRTFLGRHEVEVAFSLRPMWWGRGLGTALARRLVEFARNSNLGESLVATAEQENLASIRVLEKLGFTADCQIQRAGMTMTLYRLPLKLQDQSMGAEPYP
ncbi:MAG: GNAT family N-acetyltransferase [Candidatus Dormibacteria bacterium]